MYYFMSLLLFLLQFKVSYFTKSHCLYLQQVCSRDGMNGTSMESIVSIRELSMLYDLRSVSVTACVKPLQMSNSFERNQVIPLEIGIVGQICTNSILIALL